jgi:hypothetical protein
VKTLKTFLTSPLFAACFCAALMLLAGPAFAQSPPSVDWATGISGAKNELVATIAQGVGPLLLIVAVTAGFAFIYKKVKAGMRSS